MSPQREGTVRLRVQLSKDDGQNEYQPVAMLTTHHNKHNTLQSIYHLTQNFSQLHETLAYPQSAIPSWP